MEQIQKLQDDIKQWSDSAFGSHRTGAPIAYHLKKETDELIDAIEKLHQGVYCNSSDPQDGIKKLGELRSHIKFEAADCLMLLIDTLAHEGISTSELIASAIEKLEINKKRKWGTPDINGVIEHIEQ